MELIKKDILVEKQMKKYFLASLSEEKSGHLENNCLLWLVPQYFLIHDVKDCLMYLIKSSRTSDLCLVLRDPVTKDANGNAAANLDLTLDWWETSKIQKKKKGQSCHNLFNHLSKTKSPAKQPFSFLIKWEAGQNKHKGVSAVLETCNREQFGVARRQVYILLPPYNTMLCSLPSTSTSREGSPMH